MQAIILAAGAGRRLAPFTCDKPKCFLEIGGRKIIDWQLLLLEEFGIDNIVVVTGYNHSLIDGYLNSRPNVKTVYNASFATTNVLFSFCTGMSLLHEAFIYLHGDTIFDLPIMEKLIEAEGDIVLPVDTKPCGEEEMKVQLDGNGDIVKISKALEPGLCLGEFIGIARVEGNILPELKETVSRLIREGQKKAFFEEALQCLADRCRQRFSPVDVTGLYWEEIDFIEDYNAALRNFTRSSLKKLSPGSIWSSR